MMDELVLHQQDTTHGRTWELYALPAVVGFRYTIYIQPIRRAVAEGWCEGDMEESAPKLLVCIMMSLGAAPERLPKRFPALDTLLSTAQIAVIRECQQVAEAVETGRVTTTHTVSQALQAMVDGRK